MRTSPLRLAQISGLALSLAGPMASAQPIITNWGGPANGLWSAAANWNPATVPMNVPPFPTFDVRITGGGSPTTHDKGTTAIPNVVTLLTLGGGHELQIPASKALSVSSQASLCGYLNVTGGSFDAPDAMFTCNQAQVRVAGGGTAHIGAPTYDSSGLSASAVALLVTGAGSTLDLASLTSITDSWGACCNSFEHLISANGGGHLDLGGVQTITGPADDERLTIAAATGGTINLAGLVSVAASGNGAVDFTISSAGALSLPLVQTLSRARCFISGGGQLHVSGPAPVAYNSSGIGYATTILSASDAGSALDLRSVTSITDTWGACCNSFEHKITASNGALIDLRGLQAITGPADDERLTITAASGGMIDLTGLTTVAASGNGAVDFTVTDPSALSLPSVQSLGRTRFFVSGGGQVHASGAGPASFNSSGIGYATTILSVDGAGSALDLRSVTSITDTWGACCNSFEHKISASNGGVLDLRGVQTITGPADDERLTIALATGGSINLSGLTTVTASGNGAVDFTVTDPSLLTLPSVQSLGRTRFFVSGGGELHTTGSGPTTYNSSGIGYATTILSVAGAGSVLDLRSVTSITDSWGACCNSFEHRISASNGGVLDLRGVQTITGPGDDERLEFVVDGGTIILGTPSATAGNIPRMTLQSAMSRLEVLGSLRLGTFPPPPVNPPLPMPLTAAAGSTMTIGGDFVFTHTNEANITLDKATVQFDGVGPQHCEVGGVDLGPSGACLLPNGNFGFGQLVVGKTGQATTLRLSDLIDNGNRAGRPEALYLWGSFDRGNPPTTPCGPTTPQTNGLRILAGSTLILDGVNVYAFQNGQWIHLNCFFSSTVTRVAYDGGFIERAGCYANCDNSSTPPVLNVNDFVCFNNRFVEGNCYANCDGSTALPNLSVNDYICFINKFATGCP